MLAVSNVTLTPSGVSAATAVGSVDNIYTITIDGVSAITEVGSMNIWQEINTSQTPGYGVISTSQTPNWTQIAA